MIRRNFLTSIPGVIVLANSLFSREVSAKSNVFAVSRSGIYGHSDFYLSVLRTSRLVDFEDFVAGLRSKYDFRSKIQYSNNDKYKYPFINSILEYLSKEDGLSFAVKKYGFESGKKSGVLDSKLKRYTKLNNDIYEMLNYLGVSDQDMILMKSEMSTTQGTKLVRNYNSRYRNPIVPKMYYESDFVQVGSLIGSLYRVVDTNCPVNSANKLVVNKFRELNIIDKLKA